MVHKSLWAIIICVVLVVTTVPSHAEGLFLGVKLAYFELDIPSVDDPDNVGIVAGYDWLLKYGTIGVVGEYTTTFEDGNLAGEKVDIDTAGLYATYKTKGLGNKGMGPYLKAKAGAAYHDLSIGSTSEDDTNFSAGVGVGLNMATLSFELEYTMLDSDVHMISLLIRF